MKEIINLMSERTALLKKAIKKAERESGTFPEGRLRISNTKRQKRYYHVTADTDTTGNYLPKNKNKLISALAQKEYNKRFLNQAYRELSWLEKTISHFDSANADIAYESLSSERRDLISPYIIPDEMYAREWQNKPFKSNPYLPENKIYDTRRGEKVRSKSEAILADMFFELGIPYYYEKALSLKNGAVRYPDFTLLKIKTREEIYLEHFGLLDDDEYRNNFFHKLYEYRQSGIYPGKNLLFTYETADSPLDIKGTKKMIGELLL